MVQQNDDDRIHALRPRSQRTNHRYRLRLGTLRVASCTDPSHTMRWWSIINFNRQTVKNYLVFSTIPCTCATRDPLRAIRDLRIRLVSIAPVLLVARNIFNENRATVFNQLHGCAPTRIILFNCLHPYRLDFILIAVQWRFSLLYAFTSRWSYGSFCSILRSSVKIRNFESRFSRYSVRVL
jgi:hypothetical protein